MVLLIVFFSSRYRLVGDALKPRLKATLCMGSKKP